jgi:hypothetical protein
LQEAVREAEAQHLQEAVREAEARYLTAEADPYLKKEVQKSVWVKKP